MIVCEEKEFVAAELIFLRRDNFVKKQKGILKMIFFWEVVKIKPDVRQRERRVIVFQSKVCIPLSHHIVSTY